MDGYLTKPIDSRKLGAMLAKHMPQALPLRREAGAGSEGVEAGPEMDWDPDIFDPEVLGASFDGLDDEAKALISDAAATWSDRIERIDEAMAAGDLKTARDVTHVLKGATLSVGANRLGRIASDLQDCLDNGDAEMAAIMVEILHPTLDEFQGTLPKILEL
jgi:HPt (histidine-containing phosphotransfer) domain-containing protein